MFHLKDRIVVVTGGASGIGLALARASAARGAKVAIADIDQKRALAVAAELSQTGAAVAGFSVDVTDLGSLERLAEEVASSLGAINVVFCNAGVFSYGAIDRTRPSDLDWLIAVNVRGLYNTITAFLPALRRAAADGGLAHFVTTGSENSLALPTLGPFTAYTATKHAVLGLTEGLKRDLAGTGIGVSIICPGVVQTELWNAKRARHHRFGGAREAPSEASTSMSEGRTPEATAETAFSGLDCDEFIIVTDPRIRSFTVQRLEAISTALDACDARVPGL